MSPEYANEAMENFIACDLDIIFEDYFTIQDKIEHRDSDGFLQIDVVVMLGNTIISVPFRIDPDGEPAVVMSEMHAVYEEATREGVYAFCMFELEEKLNAKNR